MLKRIKGQKSKFAIPEKFACDIQGVCVFKNPGGSTVHVEKSRGSRAEKVKSRGICASENPEGVLKLEKNPGC